MEDLVRFVVLEAAIDDTQGVSIPRLWHFVHAFHARSTVHPSTIATLPFKIAPGNDRNNDNTDEGNLQPPTVIEPAHPPKAGDMALDLSYLRFIWRLLVAEVPENLASARRVERRLTVKAGKNAAKRRKVMIESGSKSIAVVGGTETTEIVETAEYDPLDAADLALDVIDLWIKYGKDLCLYIPKEQQQELIFANIDGRLSDQMMTVYRAILRWRAHGTTQADLSGAIGMDPRSVFHFVKILAERTLIFKLPVVEKSAKTHSLVALPYAIYSPVCVATMEVALVRQSLHAVGGSLGGLQPESAMRRARVKREQVAGVHGDDEEDIDDEDDDDDDDEQEPALALAMRSISGASDAILNSIRSRNAAAAARALRSNGRLAGGDSEEEEGSDEAMQVDPPAAATATAETGATTPANANGTAPLTARAAAAVMLLQTGPVDFSEMSAGAKPGVFADVARQRMSDFLIAHGGPSRTLPCATIMGALGLQVGIGKPTNKVHRKWFNRNVAYMANAGYVQRVQIPNDVPEGVDRRAAAVPGKPVHSPLSTNGIRLLHPYSFTLISGNSSTVPFTARLKCDRAGGAQSAEGSRDPNEDPALSQQDGVLVDLPFEIQIHRLLVNAPRGLTGRDLRRQLGRIAARPFGKMMDKLVASAKTPAFALTVDRMAENVGRERRYRYFASANAKRLLGQDAAFDLAVSTGSSGLRRTTVSATPLRIVATPAAVRSHAARSADATNGDDGDDHVEGRDDQPAASSAAPSPLATPSRPAVPRTSRRSTLLASATSSAAASTSSAATAAASTTATGTGPAALIAPSTPGPATSTIPAPAPATLTETNAAGATPRIQVLSMTQMRGSVTTMRRNMVILDLIRELRVVEVNADFVKLTEDRFYERFPPEADGLPRTSLDKKTVVRTIRNLRADKLIVQFKVLLEHVAGGHVEVDFVVFNDAEVPVTPEEVSSLARKLADARITRTSRANVGAMRAARRSTGAYDIARTGPSGSVLTVLADGTVSTNPPPSASLGGDPIPPGGATAADSAAASSSNDMGEVPATPRTIPPTPTSTRMGRSWREVAQEYGWIDARMLRAKQLHLFLFHRTHLSAGGAGDHGVPPLFATSELYNALTFGQYLQLIGHNRESVMVETAIDKYWTVPLIKCPETLRREMLINDKDMRRYNDNMAKLINILVALNVIEPVAEDEPPTPMAKVAVAAARTRGIRSRGAGALSYAPKPPPAPPQQQASGDGDGDAASPQVPTAAAAQRPPEPYFRTVRENTPLAAYYLIPASTHTLNYLEKQEARTEQTVRNMSTLANVQEFWSELELLRTSIRFQTREARHTSSSSSAAAGTAAAGADDADEEDDKEDAEEDADSDAMDVDPTPTPRRSTRSAPISVGGALPSEIRTTSLPTRDGNGDDDEESELTPRASRQRKSKPVPPETPKIKVSAADYVHEVIIPGSKPGLDPIKHLTNTRNWVPSAMLTHKQRQILEDYCVVDEGCTPRLAEATCVIIARKANLPVAKVKQFFQKIEEEHQLRELIRQENSADTGLLATRAILNYRDGEEINRSELEAVRQSMVGSHLPIHSRSLPPPLMATPLSPSAAGPGNNNYNSNNHASAASADGMGLTPPTASTPTPPLIPLAAVRRARRSALAQSSQRTNPAVPTLSEPVVIRTGTRTRTVQRLNPETGEVEVEVERLRRRRLGWNSESDDMLMRIWTILKHRVHLKLDKRMAWLQATKITGKSTEMMRRRGTYLSRRPDEAHYLQQLTAKWNRHWEECQECTKFHRRNLLLQPITSADMHVSADVLTDGFDLQLALEHLAAIPDDTGVSGPDLPDSIEELMAEFDVVEHDQLVPLQEEVYSTMTMRHRLTVLHDTALYVCPHGGSSEPRTPILDHHHQQQLSQQQADGLMDLDEPPLSAISRLTSAGASASVSDMDVPDTPMFDRAMVTPTTPAAMSQQFQHPLPSRPEEVQEQVDLVIQLLKMICLTPQHQYDARRAFAMLNAFPIPIISRALSIAKEQGVVIRNRPSTAKSRMIPGRNYALTDQFCSLLFKDKVYFKIVTGISSLITLSVHMTDAMKKYEQDQIEYDRQLRDREENLNNANNDEDTPTFAPPPVLPDPPRLSNSFVLDDMIDDGTMLALIDLVVSGHVKLSVDLNLGDLYSLPVVPARSREFSMDIPIGVELLPSIPFPVVHLPGPRIPSTHPAVLMRCTPDDDDDSIDVDGEDSITAHGERMLIRVGINEHVFIDPTVESAMRMHMLRRHRGDPSDSGLFGMVSADGLQRLERESAEDMALEPDARLRGWVVPRLWNNINGHVIIEVLRNCLTSIIIFLMHNPGARLSFVYEKFRIALCRTEVDELVEQLVRRGAVSTLQLQSEVFLFLEPGFFYKIV
ncbi:hypothetical protein BC828DRAFT_371876 [Blastocladiella britannica]|nr:hypothetical protein BC828DRAFT_371876 [Blastocladiella britannica]